MKKNNQSYIVYVVHEERFSSNFLNDLFMDP